MWRRHHRLVVAVAVGLCVALASACGGGGSGGNGKITIVGSNWIGNAPAWVGMDTGIFKRAGFNVSYRTVTASGDRLKAIASGDVQLASVGQQAMLSSMAQGDDSFKWVGSQDAAFGVEGIIAQSGVSSLASLKGKSLGLPVGSGSYVTAYLLLQDAGLDLEKDVHVVNIGLEDTVSALANHNVDAVATYDPYFTQARQLQGVRVLGTDEQSPLFRKYHQMSGPDCLAIAASLVSDNTDQATSLVRAYFQAVAWIAQHPDQAVPIIARYTHQPLGSVQENLHHFEWYGVDAQRTLMNRIYGQTEAVLPILQKAKVLQSRPEYRKWAWLDYTNGGSRRSSG